MGELTHDEARGEMGLPPFDLTAGESKLATERTATPGVGTALLAAYFAMAVTLVLLFGARLL